MAQEHTLEEWQQLLGPTRKITKEEYEKTLKRKEQMDKIKGLLTAGKKSLGNIIENVKPIANELADRLQANYDTAIGQPRFGVSIRDALGFEPNQPLNNPQMNTGYPAYQTNGYGIPFLDGINGYENSIPNVNGLNMQSSLQYPKEIFTLPDNLNNHSMENQMQQGSIQPSTQIPNTYSSNTNEPSNNDQVVFLYGNKDDKVTEVISEYPSAQEAQAEVEKLKKQGLPAFYGPKGDYIYNARVKA